MPLLRFRIWRFIFIKYLRLTRRDIDFFYGECFANLSWRDKIWAGNFCDLMLGVFNPRSVVDFGCGIGDILYQFERKGIDILGIDASKVCHKYAKISKGNFLLFDLRNNFYSPGKYDIALCLEVAEHIEEKYSDILVRNITQSSPVIVFTAAPPGQGGMDHCNEKPREWWIDRFQKQGFDINQHLTDALRKELINFPGILELEHYVKNMMVFLKR